jgi:hypothetical protein
MEPALGERDDVSAKSDRERLITTAMEPALGERDDGSRKTSRLTCGDMAACERRRNEGTVSLLDGLVKVHARPLTWVRALPGITLTTKALALRR